MAVIRHYVGKLKDTKKAIPLKDLKIFDNQILSFAILLESNIEKEQSVILTNVKDLGLVKSIIDFEILAYTTEPELGGNMVDVGGISLTYTKEKNIELKNSNKESITRGSKINFKLIIGA